jgi:hypothetical protein
MFVAAQSLTSLRNSPLALAISGPPPDLSLAASSLGLISTGSANPSEPLSPWARKKLYKAPKKSCNVTRLILVDEIPRADAHVDIQTSTFFEAAGSAMPPPVP